MIAKTIKYEDFNGKARSDVVHFHISKDIITDHMDLEDQFREIAVYFEGEKRELTRPEVAKILKLIKRLIKLGYGVRSEDGERFAQSKALYRDFHDSAAYDALLWDMFSNPEDAVTFMTAILPQDLVARADAQLKEKRAIPQDHQPKKDRTAKKTAEITPVPFEEPEVESVEERRERLKRELDELG